MIIEVEKDSVAGQYARALDPLSMLLLVPLVALFWVGAFINILLPIVIIAMGPAWLLAICATKKRVDLFSLTWKITAVYIGGGLAAFAISTYTGGEGIASLLLGGLSIILTLLGLGIIQNQGRSIISTGLTFCLAVGMLCLGYICGIEQNGINEVPRGKAPEARALAIKQIQEIADKISEIKWQAAAAKIRAKDFAAAEQIVRIDIFDGKLLNRHDRSKSFELRMRWEKEYGAILNEKSAQNIAKIKTWKKRTVGSLAILFHAARVHQQDQGSVNGFLRSGSPRHAPVSFRFLFCCWLCALGSFVVKPDLSFLCVFCVFRG